MVFAGKFVRASHDNYEPFMTKLGLPEELRAKILEATPVLEIQDLGEGKFRILTEMPMKSIDKTFEMGQSFEDVTPGGMDCVTTINKPTDDTWVIDMSLADGSKKVRLNRKFSEAGIEDEVEFEGEVAKLVFKRQ